MKRTNSGKRAFTLIELLTVLAVISILGSLLLPAMARTRNRSYDAGCLGGLRQMMTGWAMYKDENNDSLVPNVTQQSISDGWIPPNPTENWQNSNGNTNILLYTNGLLSPYLNNHLEGYRCPADVIPSVNGTRVRSRSMNCQVAGPGDIFNSGWRIYLKGSDLTCPQPKDVWVFADESMYSLNDGSLETILSGPSYYDIPANYHDGGCGFSFADCHAEIHKWLWGGTSTAGLVNVPYAFGVTGNGQSWGSSKQDVDWIWLQAHTACKN